MSIIRRQKLEEKSMNLETSKLLAGIGALLMFIGVIPFVSHYGIIEIIGVILVLAAL